MLRNLNSTPELRKPRTAYLDIENLQNVAYTLKVSGSPPQIDLSPCRVSGRGRRGRRRGAAGDIGLSSQAGQLYQTRGGARPPEQHRCAGPANGRGCILSALLCRCGPSAVRSA